MADIRDLTRAPKDFSRGLRARDPEDLHRLKVPEAPPSLKRPLALFFLVMVLAPCIALYLYLALLISPQYESVSTFVIRGDVEHTGNRLAGLLSSVSAVAAATHSQEAGMLARYLPAPLSDDELAALVHEALAEGGFDSPGQMGLAMKAAVAKVAGRADGKAVSALVKAALAGG